MYPLFVITCVLPLLAHSRKLVVLTNDDGWAVKNIRTFRDYLANDGHAVLLSAPAHDESLGASMDEIPTSLIVPCQFDSCPAGSPPIGFSNATDHVYYVNSVPVTAMQYGLERAREVYPDTPIDLAIAGPNIGCTYSHPRLPDEIHTSTFTRA